MPTREPTEQSARQFAVALNSRRGGDVQSSVRIFKGRPRDSIVLSFGAPFAAALEQLPPGEWRMIASKDGARIIQLQKIEAARSPAFEAVQGTVYRDWRVAQEQALLAAAIEALKKKYVVQAASHAP
jgi:hypothetical protein